MSPEVPGARRLTVRPSRSRLANDAWESLLTAHTSLLRRMVGAGIWDEVSMREYDVLYTLSKYGSPIRQSELSNHVLLSQPAISRLVDRLVARGLISRESDPTDRRGVLLSLSAQGAEVQGRIGRRHASDVAKVIGGCLSPVEMTELMRLLGKLTAPDAAPPQDRWAGPDTGPDHQ